MVKPVALDDLIGLAEQLAGAVAAMHGRAVMHRDICPANIVTSSDGVPCLVGFGLATPMAEIRPAFTHHSQIVGTLAYLAPEQTGRTGRPVDHRSDLYALGATLALTEHTAAAIEALPFALGNYVTAVARVLRGLAVATDARTAPAAERPGLLAEAEDLIRWLGARADDAPMNFLHLLRLLEAERAWAAGDLGAAAMAFDAARDEVAGRQRPWHRALISERAARFALARGLQHAGLELLAHARQEYLAWGATAKVAQLDSTYPALRPHADAPSEFGREAGDLRRPGSTLTTGTIDLLGILSASQAMSSETTIEGLHARVVEVLAAMTGATAVQLMVWSDERQDWLLPEEPGGTVTLSARGHDRAVPISVLRYAQRIAEPLVVADATTDDRFARDPYFADVDRCSLMCLPILSRGRLRAVVLLETRHPRAVSRQAACVVLGV